MLTDVRNYSGVQGQPCLGSVMARMMQAMVYETWKETSIWTAILTLTATSVLQGYLLN